LAEEGDLFDEADAEPAVDEDLSEEVDLFGESEAEPAAKLPAKKPKSPNDPFDDFLNDLT
jgi:hypothetical protein